MSRKFVILVLCVLARSSSAAMICATARLLSTHPELVGDARVWTDIGKLYRAGGLNDRQARNVLRRLRFNTQELGFKDVTTPLGPVLTPLVVRRVEASLAHLKKGLNRLEANPAEELETFKAADDLQLWERLAKSHSADDSQGAFNEGVFSISRSGRQENLKVSTPDGTGSLLDSHTYIEALEIQRSLGDLGYAPKLYQIYEGPQLVRVLAKLAERNLAAPPSSGLALRYGIRIENIEEGWILAPVARERWGGRIHSRIGATRNIQTGTNHSHRQPRAQASAAAPVIAKPE